MEWLLILIIGTVVTGLLLLVRKIRKELEFDSIMKAKLNQDSRDTNI